MTTIHIIIMILITIILVLIRDIYNKKDLYKKQNAELTKINSELLKKNDIFEEQKFKLAEANINLLEKNETIEEQKIKLTRANKDLLEKSELLEEQKLRIAEANLNILEANEMIKIEREKSEKLILNILPAKIANDLKEKGKTDPEKFENVTVYFSDLVGFTKLSSSLEPRILIDELNDLFTAFDNIIERNNCERIKTIGDAYLCVCGMPEKNDCHAENIINSSIEIINYLSERNRSSKIKWEMRVGIHSGVVVGGVVGLKKYIYDVFGDTINTASRMESYSEPMKINVSETTYQCVKDKYTFHPRGEFDVKGKGKMKMFFLHVP